MSHNAKQLPDKAELEARFSYDPETGDLTSKKSKEVIRRKDASGYHIVTINNKVRRVNRVIWKMMTGEDPDGIVDYIDGDIHNNKFDNLRVVSEQDFYIHKKQKEIDQGLANNTGVSYYRRTKTWRVQLKIGGETYSKYGFSTESQALEHAQMITKDLLENALNKEKREEEKKERQAIIDDLFE